MWLGSIGDYADDVRVSICDRMREAFRIQYNDSRELDLAALDANIHLSRRGVESITPEVGKLPQGVFSPRFASVLDGCCDKP